MPSITIRIDDITAEQIDDLAGAMDRSRSWIASTALKRFLQDEKRFLQDFRASIDEIDRGEGIPHETVMADLRARITEPAPREK
jgi:predicted transcriptional regulator